MEQQAAVARAFAAGGRVKGLHSLRVTVMGLGRFGGGVGVVNYLLSKGARVSLTDTAGEGALAESLKKIPVSQLERVTLGRHEPRDFTDADLIVVNPAVRRTHPLLAVAADAGVPLTSEINLFCSRNPARTIAVTGSIGKSTTATLIHLLLNSSNCRTHLGGNIGGTLLLQLDQIQAEDWVVLELSSFQLWNLNHLRFAPDVAVFTNLFPNHLDWHGTFVEYAAAKESMTRWQTNDQLLIFPQSDRVMGQWQSAARRIDSRSYVGSLLSCELPLALKGIDQLENVSAAIAVAQAGAGVPVEECISRLQHFVPLPHRREVVAEHHGRTFINDSKATTPEAAMAAIRACRPSGGRLFLLAGGADKGICLHAFANEISSSADVVALIGQTAEPLRVRIAQSGSATEVHVAHSLDAAFAWLLGRSQPGDTILLSPGCASFGEFVNYEQRGERFRQLVATSKASPSSPLSDRVVPRVPA